MSANLPEDLSGRQSAEAEALERHTVFSTRVHSSERRRPRNAQLDAAKKEFRAFVQSNDVKPENYVITLKKFFDNHMMSSLWSELKRQRQGADMAIHQA